MPSGVIDKDFARRVNEARLARHLSVRAVARLAGVPPATVQGWLSGEHQPSRALRVNYLTLIGHLGLLNQLPEEFLRGFPEGAIRGR